MYDSLIVVSKYSAYKPDLLPWINGSWSIGNTMQRFLLTIMENPPSNSGIAPVMVRLLSLRQ